MAMKEITPQQAHEVLQREAGAVYIDVRTEREFAAGHPQGAVNIPVAFPDPGRGMVMNTDFVRVVGDHFPNLKHGRGFWRNARFAGQCGGARLVEFGAAREPRQRGWRELPVAFSEGFLTHIKSNFSQNPEGIHCRGKLTIEYER